MQPDEEVIEFLELLEPEPAPIASSEGGSGAFLSEGSGNDNQSSEPSGSDSDDEEYEFLELLEPESIAEQPVALPIARPRKRAWRWVGLVALCTVAGFGFFGIKRYKERGLAYTAAITEGRSKLDAKDFSGAMAVLGQALAIPGYEENKEAKQLLAEVTGAGQRLDAFSAAMNEGYRGRMEGDYAKAIAAFSEALRVQGYSDDTDARQMLHEMINAEENAKNFSLAINEGRRLHEAKKYETAVESFWSALNIPGYAENTEVAQLLKESLERALDAKNFASTVDEGKRLHGIKRYEEAATIFRQALTIPGYADDVEVSVLLEETEIAGYNARHFISIFNEGMMLHEAKEYISAINAFQRALNVPGYAENKDATQLLREAQDKELVVRNFVSIVDEGKRLYGVKQFDEAVTAFRQALVIPGHEDNAEVQELLNESEVAGHNARNFASIFNEGRLQHEAKEYAAAAAVFRLALEVPGYESHEVAVQLLHESDFAAAFFEGARQIEAKEFDTAALTFQRALDIPGNERHHDTVRQWLTHAKEAQQIAEQIARNRINFNAAVTQGQERYSEEDYSGAAEAFEKALSIPGYADHAQVKQWLTAMREAEAKELEQQRENQRAMERAAQDRAMAAAQPLVPIPAAMFAPTVAPAAPAPAVMPMRPQPPFAAVQWFAVLDGRPSGPFTLDTLSNEIASGRMTRATSVWREGMGGWMSAGSVPELASRLPVAPPPFTARVAAPVRNQASPEEGNAPQPAKRDGMNPEVKNVLKGIAGAVLNEVFKRSR